MLLPLFSVYCLFSLSLSSTAEVYIGMGKAAEATACTQEAANLFPMSHNVLFYEGSGGGAAGECGRGQALVRGGAVHQPHPRQDHAETGEHICLSANWNPFAVLHFHVYCSPQCSWFQVLLFLWERLVVCFFDRHAEMEERGEISSCVSI